MRLTAPLALAAGLLASAGAPDTAVAQYQIGSFADPFWGRQGSYLCRRWCIDDRTPCDSVQYKAADGRCNGEARTFFGELQCRIGKDGRPICPVGP
jgi:hypothetical protein